MNPSAAHRYQKYGGRALVGKSLLSCHDDQANAAIGKVVQWFGESPKNNRVHTIRNEKAQKDVYMIALRDDQGQLIGYYEQHLFRAWETAGLYELTPDK